MMISVIAVLLPAAFHFTSTMLTGAEELRAILAVSRGVCLFLLCSRGIHIYPTETFRRFLSSCFSVSSVVISAYASKDNFTRPSLRRLPMFPALLP